MLRSSLVLLTWNAIAAFSEECVAKLVHQVLLLHLVVRNNHGRSYALPTLLFGSKIKNVHHDNYNVSLCYSSFVLCSFGIISTEASAPAVLSFNK